MWSGSDMPHYPINRPRKTSCRLFTHNFLSRDTERSPGFPRDGGITLGVINRGFAQPLSPGHTWGMQVLKSGSRP
jgi:hypothetical protein